MEFILLVLIYGIPLTLILFMGFSVYKLFKLSRRNDKTYKTYIKIGLLFIFFACGVMMFLPPEARYAISEYRLKPILKQGTKLETVETFINKKNMHYTITDAEKCEERKNYGFNDKVCDEIPFISIRLPIIFSFIEGSIRVRIYFNDNNELERYHFGHSYTFL